MTSIRIEAEQMNLTTYRVESDRTPASGNALITLHKTGGTSGSATTTFTGSSGTYDVILGYFDENDGQSPITVRIGSQESSFVFDENYGDGGVSSQNHVARTVATGLSLNSGEAIEIFGAVDSTEFARIDYIEFVPVAEPEPIAQPGTLEFSAGRFTLDENGTATQGITLTRTDGADGDVTVNVSAADGTATSPDDYDNSDILVSFADGETEKTVTLALIDDTEDEADETLTLSLSNPIGGATLGSAASAVVTIVDNDMSSGINGTDDSETLSGNALDNPIAGFGGDDTLNGGEGHDTLAGGPGNNYLDGGEGTDTASYAAIATSRVIANLETGVATRYFTPFSATPIALLPLGDSNTRGKPNQENYAGYRTHLWNRLVTGDGFNMDFVGSAHSGPDGMDKDHEGRGGFTIDELTDNSSNFKGYNKPGAPDYTTIEDTLSDNPADLILLMAGTNDINRGDDVNVAIAELNVLVDRIVTHSPDARVLVGSILPNTADSDREARTAEFSGRIFNEVISPKINAGKKVSFVDIYNAPLETADFNSDGYHLVDSGYEKIAQVWYEEIVASVSGEDTLSQVENLVGSDYDDVLTGDTNVNQISGGSGDDILRGAGSDDTLSGGPGNDLFVLGAGEGTDTILDFEVGQDLLGLMGDLSYDNLMIRSGSGTHANHTEIAIADTNELLALLADISPTRINSDAFIAL
ncbi:Calx-beta domain-containing protein [Phormidium sp. CCY1219]|uniref:Calx-beta domain-containing protein n=1 Tax=Phormidium sp. CCY1219 TaxID=2886104 RepID=UPI002D1F4C15|nr:Calx-beta domain-containing protein [Phormidium sp. CCY1219]MEB3828332.1 GDSL-type esterase/lipase family protein [Phormidium sp. CCY1219]